MTLHNPVLGNSPEGRTNFQQQVAIACTPCCQIGTEQLAEVAEQSGYLMSNLSIALYQPDIAGNTGTILRLAACLGLKVEIIEPAGFDTSDRNLKRAGMDYLET